jgi:hypothetical protein
MNSDKRKENEGLFGKDFFIETFEEENEKKVEVNVA